MSYWGKYQKFTKKLVNTYKKMELPPFVLIDGGAAGDIPPPFSLSKSILKNIRFEPRTKAIVVNQTGSDIIVDAGLWSNDCRQTLNISLSPTTSSMYKPNIELLKNIEENQGLKIRGTHHKEEIKCRSIDSLVKKKEIPLPNFIKLDVHSAELPALIGAKASLSECVGLLVETWNVEVHKGQGLSWQVEKFALDNGFEVYDSMCQARWQILHKNTRNSYDRGRYIGSEILFIKKNIKPNLIYQKSFCLALFGFFNEAKNCLYELNDTNDPMYNTINEIQDDIEKDLILKFKYFVSIFVNKLRGYFY